MGSRSPINIMWLRRDLRLHDNRALYEALSSGVPVLPLFVFDRDILDSLSERRDLRVQFIHEQLQVLQRQLRQHGSDILCLHARPLEAFKQLLDQYDVQAVYCNEDYEPVAIARDNEVSAFCASRAVRFHSFKDQLIFAPTEITKSDGLPYTVYTPFSKQWKNRLSDNDLRCYDSASLHHNFCTIHLEDLPSLQSLGFVKTEIHFPSTSLKPEVLRHYKEVRDIPSLDATSHLSVHLRFGTVSVRELLKEAQRINEHWLNELIWREFFMMILGNFPRVVHSCFKPQYEAIAWRNNEEEFAAWCEGKTGYPIVDAGMRELNSTGFMHNRVRMIVASFLCKHLLIDWRWGEAYFAQKLLDYELSSNNGNWQWSAGCGCDAAPYFRIFNPAEQTRKFDPSQEYIRRWLQADDLLRPPIVDHVVARQRVLQTYQKALKDFQAK